MRSKILPTAVLMSSLMLSAPARPATSDKDKATMLGGISVDMSFCEQYDKWSSIISAYSNILMPVGGALGITTGTMMNTSVLVDYCQFLAGLKHMGLQGEINMAANLANKMSGDQFTKEINLTRDLFDMTSSVVDLEKGGEKKGVWQSAATHRRLARTLKSTADYAGVDMKTRSEKQGDMARLARISYQRSVLKETVKCPTPPSDNEDWNKIQEKEVIPLENNIEVLEEYIKGYQRALLEMGRKFVSFNEYEQYVKDLENVVYRSNTISGEFRDKSVETIKLQKVAAPSDPNDPTAKRTEEVKSKINQKYQVFTPRANLSFKNEFIKKYNNLWNLYVKGTAYTTTRGILNNPTKRVEDEFKDFSILCNRGKYSEQFDRQDPDYSNKVHNAMEECKKSSTASIEASGGLFQYYVDSLVQRDGMMKMNLAKLWGLESEHLGYTRIVSEGTPNGVAEAFSQPESSCAPMNNIAKMAEIQLRQQALEAELNQEVVEQIMKQNAILEAEENRKKEEKEAQERRNRINEEIQRRKTWVDDDMKPTSFDNLKF
jgi:hypothetical protein